MKVNELFTLRHTSFDTPEYSYRFHSKSLTSKDKELKITENRYRQMLLDEFRRDYYLKTMYWIIQTDDWNKTAVRKLVTAIEKAGHRLLTMEQAGEQTANLYERCIFVSFGEKLVNETAISQDAFKVLYLERPANISNYKIDYDAYICAERVTDKDYIGSYKGWYGIETGADLFTFLDSKARNRFLYELEGDGAADRGYEKKFSIIISYEGNQTRLRKCIESLAGAAEAETIVVGSPKNINEMTALGFPEIKWVSVWDENDITRKNVAARVADGEYLVFLQDDCFVEKGYLEKLAKIFAVDDKVAVVYGNVEVLTGVGQERYLRLLGEYRLEKDDIYEYSAADIPSGYSFAIRSEYFKMVGGFYHIENHCPAHFCDIAMFGMAMALKNYGYHLYLSADCRVKRVAYRPNEMELSDMLIQAGMGRYYLEINGIVPYDTWPEVLERAKTCTETAIQENRADIWQLSQKKLYEKLLQRTCDDCREREKANLNRDLFSRLV